MQPQTYAVSNANPTDDKHNKSAKTDNATNAKPESQAEAGSLVASLECALERALVSSRQAEAGKRAHTGAIGAEHWICMQAYRRTCA